MINFMIIAPHFKSFKKGLLHCQEDIQNDNAEVLTSQLPYLCVIKHSHGKSTDLQMMNCH